MSVGTYAGPESHLTGPDWRAVSRDEELTRRLDKARASDGVALWVGFSRTQFEGTKVPFKEQLQACRIDQGPTASRLWTWSVQVVTSHRMCPLLPICYQHVAGLVPKRRTIRKPGIPEKASGYVPASLEAMNPVLQLVTNGMAASEGEPGQGKRNPRGEES